VLVVFWVGPLGEVSNMSLHLEFVGPVGTTAEDSVINTDREEDFPFLSYLSIKRRFHFVANPFAFNRVFGENEQELVLHIDGLIDAFTNELTGAEIMRGKPALYLPVLQICVQTVCKQFIGATMANEATIVSNGLHRHILINVNPFVRNTGSTKKMECAAILRKFYGV